jgi:hypothetical protein
MKKSLLIIFIIGFLKTYSLFSDVVIDDFTEGSLVGMFQFDETQTGSTNHLIWGCRRIILNTEGNPSVDPNLPNSTVSLVITNTVDGNGDTNTQGKLIYHRLQPDVFAILYNNDNKSINLSDCDRFRFDITYPTSSLNIYLRIGDKKVYNAYSKAFKKNQKIDFLFRDMPDMDFSRITKLEIFLGQNNGTYTINSILAINDADSTIDTFVDFSYNLQLSNNIPYMVISATVFAQRNAVYSLQTTDVCDGDWTVLESWDASKDSGIKFYTEPATNSVKFYRIVKQINN